MCCYQESKQLAALNFWRSEPQLTQVLGWGSSFKSVYFWLNIEDEFSNAINWFRDISQLRTIYHFTNLAARSKKTLAVLVPSSFEREMENAKLTILYQMTSFYSYFILRDIIVVQNWYDTKMLYWHSWFDLEYVGSVKALAKRCSCLQND